MLGEEIKTTICQNDGLKEKMKLIIYDDYNLKDDFTIIDEAKVSEVGETHSLAHILEKLNKKNINAEEVVTWKVITR